jgi:ribulose-5-phosphate 4-epimerase/fuculose-1-phosphate aldolase
MQQEGVIKFELRFTLAPAIPENTLNELNKWRNILWKHALIGQDPDRYDGYGFGNISQRIGCRNEAAGKRSFAVSGTQTGHLEQLDNRHYARVTAYDADSNLVIADGPVRPSSESMTHGVIYDLDNEISVVLHVHSPDIWQTAFMQEIPVTHASIEYGTPDMSREVVRLFSQTDVMKKGIFSMGGHKDGIVAFGNSAEEAGNRLLTALSYSLKNDPR